MPTSSKYVKLDGAEPSLLPPPFPIGINPLYTQHTDGVILQVHQDGASISGDDYQVTDMATNQCVLHVHGNAKSLSSKKDIRDTQGNDLYILRRKKMAVHHTYKGASVDGTDLFEIKSAYLSAGAKLTMTFINEADPSNRSMELHIRGDLSYRHAQVTLEDGQVIARISTDKADAGKTLLQMRRYILTVAPRVDISLMLAVCICIDEMGNELYP